MLTDGGPGSRSPRNSKPAWLQTVENLNLQSLDSCLASQSQIFFSLCLYFGGTWRKQALMAWSLLRCLKVLIGSWESQAELPQLSERSTHLLVRILNKRGSIITGKKTWNQCFVWFDFRLSCGRLAQGEWHRLGEAVSGGSNPDVAQY